MKIPGCVLTQPLPRRSLLPLALPLASLLLPALLDSLEHPDKSRHAGDPFAASQVARVVADTLVANPAGTDRRLNARLQRAEPGYAKRLWQCYYDACRNSQDGALPRRVVNTIVRRSVRLLEKDSDLELLREIAETLDLLCRNQGEQVEVLLRDMTRLVFQWSERLRTTENQGPETEDLTAGSALTFLTFLTFDSKRLAVSGVLSHLKASMESLAMRDPRAYIAMVRRRWNAAGSYSARVPLLNVLGAVVRDQETFDLARPLLFRSLASENPAERAAALKAIAQAGACDVRVPVDLADRVLGAFADEMLIVVLGAIRAAHRLEVPRGAGAGLIRFLVDFASVYGPKRIYSHDVESALLLAVKLAKGTTDESTVAGRVLEVIDALPSAEAAPLLSALGLEGHSAWPAVAVRALRLDDDPQYRDLGRLGGFAHLAQARSETLCPACPILRRSGRHSIGAIAVRSVVGLGHGRPTSLPSGTRTGRDIV